jgi:dienelactone hydrolase
MTNLKAAAFVIALLFEPAAACSAAWSQSSASVVEFESPLASPMPLQGYLRQPNSAGPSPAVVLLHGCSGNWGRLDEYWGKRIASWGYVTLTVDSFGPRGIKSTCSSGAPIDLALDAYRALSFLVRQPFVDPGRVAVLGFSQGGWLALTSIEHGAIEQNSRDKFRAAAAFYPKCLGSKGNMTVPTLILIGELDDWTLAQECRNMVEGRDDWGISRISGQGVPARLIVYPGAYHAFDAPGLERPIEFLGHHLEYNKSAADQATDALREFLEQHIGEKAKAP